MPRYTGIPGCYTWVYGIPRHPYPSAPAANENDLPPPGPYLSKFALQSVIGTLNEAIKAIDLAEAEEEIGDVKAALVLARETLQAKIGDLEEV